MAQAGQVIAGAILTKDGPGQPVAGQRDAGSVALLSGFGAGGFLNVTGHPDARATLAVVILPDSPPSTSIADPQSQRLVTFAQQLNLAGQGTVVAGSVAGSGPGSAIDVMRNGGRAGHLSSVDNADHAIGQIVVAQALYEQLRGVSGSYGSGPGATAPGPSPAPTPASLQPVPSQPSRPAAQGREVMSRRHGPPARAAMTAGAAAVPWRAAAGYAATLRRRPPGGAAAWTRTNHRGEPVTLLEGPAAALGAALASALAPGLPPRGRAALVAAGAGAAAFGGYDDLAGSGDRRGFRGHLGALAGGEVTTGAVKIGGIGATGVVAAALIGGRPADVIINAGLTAGGANLLNLFDLRPGRALKVALAGSALIAGTGGPGAARAVAGPAGAALALLPEDLGERAMLGDAGANALGADARGRRGGEPAPRRPAWPSWPGSSA